MKKILFIINAKSGTKRNKNIEHFAALHLPKEEFEAHFEYTQYAGHAAVIAENNVQTFDIIAAVGGDGTMHEVAQKLIHTKTILACIPMGSGNGLARFLHIPLHTAKAIELIKKGTVKTIDTILCNNEYFINVAGLGFDAKIGDVFDKTPHRGGFKYIKLVGKELLQYKPQTLTFCSENENFNRTFFVASVANSSQYGLNAHIAPEADITDGYFEVVFIKKFPIYKAVDLAWKLFTKKIHKSKYVETIKLSSITVKNNTTCLLHLDGEPRSFDTDITFTMQKQSLTIIS